MPANPPIIIKDQKHGLPMSKGLLAQSSSPMVDTPGQSSTTANQTAGQAVAGPAEDAVYSTGQGPVMPLQYQLTQTYQAAAAQGMIPSGAGSQSSTGGAGG